jgi:ribosome-associated toxin RatA of RatAB toxin-antitoxin module
MIFTCTVDINLPRNRVIELFDNAENMKKWQDGLVSFEHLEGEPGQVGAKSKLVYKNGKKTFDLSEQITVRNFPDEFSGTYDHEAMINTMTNKFTELGADKTRWIAHLDYTFKTTMWRFFSKFMTGMFKKQTQKFLDNFKKFAESESA